MAVIYSTNLTHTKKNPILILRYASLNIEIYIHCLKKKNEMNCVGEVIKSETLQVEKN